MRWSRGLQKKNSRKNMLDLIKDSRGGGGWIEFTIRKLHMYIVHTRADTGGNQGTVSPPEPFKGGKSPP